MPEHTMQVTAASLWDLRALCEQQLRSLTDAQRLVDEYRAGGYRDDLLRRRIAIDLQQVARASHLITESAASAAQKVDNLGLTPPTER